MADPNEAFRYFWLFFRQNAFVTSEVQRDGQTRELSFLDRLWTRARATPRVSESA